MRAEAGLCGLSLVWSQTGPARAVTVTVNRQPDPGPRGQKAAGGEKIADGLALIVGDSDTPPDSGLIQDTVGQLAMRSSH